jgi:hypothetical protein
VPEVIVVTTNAELRRSIRDMAEQLAEGVVKLISSMSLKQLAALTGGGPAPRVAAEPREDSKPAARGRPKGKRGPGRPPKVEKERKLNRRKGTEIEKLRRGVLDVLKGNDEWLSAKEIGQKIGRGVGTEDLSFPINYLRDRGLVQKKGDRSQTRYKITDKGKSHEGSFTGGKKDGEGE